jgi:hypothetical protein
MCWFEAVTQEVFMFNACGDPGCGGCPLCREDVPVISGSNPAPAASYELNWTVTQTDVSYLLPLQHNTCLLGDCAANGD